jgi:hypothetical protein
MLEFTTIIVTIMEIMKTTMGPILGQPRDPTRDPTKTTCNTWGRKESVTIKPIEGAIII